MSLRYSGLAVGPTIPPSMAVTVQPGMLSRGDIQIRLDAATTLKLRAAGMRRYTD